MNNSSGAGIIGGMKRLCLLLVALSPVALWAAPRALVLDKGRSEIDIAVKATVDSFTGSLENYDVKLQVDDATGEIMASEVHFNFFDVKTGKDKRDAKMHEWQDTANHPTGVFVMQRLKTMEDGKRMAIGRLEFHGISREISFPVVVTKDQRLYSIDGEAVIDTRDYDLPIIRMMAFLKVDPQVKVHFHLQAQLADQ